MDCGDCEHFYYCYSRANTEIISWFKFNYEKNALFFIYFEIPTQGALLGLRFSIKIIVL